MCQNLSAFVCGESSKWASIESWIFESEASVHTVRSQFERLLLDIILEAERSIRIASKIWEVNTWSIWAWVAVRSFINDFTCRRRLTRVAISRGSIPWPISDDGGSGIRSFPFLGKTLATTTPIKNIQRSITSSSSTGSTVVKSMLYSWMMLGYKELKSITRMNLSQSPRLGTKTRPPLYLSRLPFVDFLPPCSSSSWGAGWLAFFP